MRKRKRAFLLPSLWLCLCLLVASCGAAGGGASRGTAVRLRLPGIPASWAFLGDFRFVISWRDSSGLAREAFCSPGECPEIDLAPGEMAAVKAWPECRGERMMPAGALYPLDLEPFSAFFAGPGPHELELSWRGGWLAEVLTSLAEAGREPGLFNFGRLEAAVEARGGDPWELDPRLAASRLIEGRLRQDFFRPVKRYAVEIPALPDPDGGAEGWVLESALAPPARFVPADAAGPDGGGSSPGTWLVSLPAGASRIHGRAFDLAARVETDGNALVVRITGGR